MKLQTGDLVFTRSPKLISRLIRLASAFRLTLAGAYIPSHVGMIRVVDGVPWVQEALWGRGFVKTPYEEWMCDHHTESVRIVRMPFTGKRYEIGRELELMEGTPYDTLLGLTRTIGDRNRDSTKRDFCSAACQRVIERALHMRIRKLDRPDNTNPYELYKWALTLGHEEVV